ncbi:MAG: hypothetical protein ACRDJ0_16835 [Actinomycetota bacterium]
MRSPLELIGYGLRGLSDRIRDRLRDPPQDVGLRVTLLDEPPRALAGDLQDLLVTLGVEQVLGPPALDTAWLAEILVFGIAALIVVLKFRSSVATPLGEGSVI